MTKTYFQLLLSLMIAISGISSSFSQITFPVNGIADVRHTTYAFTDATIIVDAEHSLKEATLLIKDEKIIAVGKDIDIPRNAVIINCTGKYIYPSFIDIFSNYGISKDAGEIDENGNRFVSKSAGPLSWNATLKPQLDAVNFFSVDEKEAEKWRKAGFGLVLTHNMDGIARGTGALVSLADKRDNLVVIKEEASAHYSFDKGSSDQSYPNSMMGSIALLRQTYLNAQWYEKLPFHKVKNISLEAWIENQKLPQIFAADGKWNDLRAADIGKEYGVNYIIKGDGEEYQRIEEMKQTGSTFILPLDFPKPIDVSNPNDARYVSLATLKHWEMAPLNPATFEEAEIPFCLTADGIKKGKTFLKNLRKAIEAGLSEKAALKALTSTPAQALRVYDLVGSLEKGKLANFLIVNKPIFDRKATILQNWVQGIQYLTANDDWTSIAGIYKLKITDNKGNTTSYKLHIKSRHSASIIEPEILSTHYTTDGKLLELFLSPAAYKVDKSPEKQVNKIKEEQKEAKKEKKEGKSENHPPLVRLNGVITGKTWEGNGVDTLGNPLVWTAEFIKKKEDSEVNEKKKSKKKKSIEEDKNRIKAQVTYPFGAYGREEMPEQKDILIKNTTVWTCEDMGVLKNTDVLVKDGKIAAIGKHLKAHAEIVIDGSDMHLTPGIIDEHSHIATSSINESGQSVTSEVRIGDNLYPEDINIYRELSGGVTTAHILHGSANPIGGQTQLIKLRWGENAEGLKFKGADPFIKFAMGENVKRTWTRRNKRYPDTRMGVWRVFMDAFTRAQDYEEAKLAYKNRGKNSKLLPPRKDLELEALVDIMNEKMFITCHSYVQSEILGLMEIADSFGFKVNTFTHILEGYKVANALKAHGANASTFSDWWLYKLEVQDAIPQNAAIMHKVGINVAINSDDPEMARRLNQEAAKSMQYGLTAEEALKLVTINPAKMLHIDDRVGSIKVGKDADLVLWNHNPLSIYAVAQKTIIDGIIYFSRERDLLLRKKKQAEKHRLIHKLNSLRNSGIKMRPVKRQKPHILHCEHIGNIQRN